MMEKTTARKCAGTTRDTGRRKYACEKDHSVHVVDRTCTARFENLSLIDATSPFKANHYVDKAVGCHKDLLGTSNLPNVSPWFETCPFFSIRGSPLRGCGRCCVSSRYAQSRFPSSIQNTKLHRQGSPDSRFRTIVLIHSTFDYSFSAIY